MELVTFLIIIAMFMVIAFTLKQQIDSFNNDSGTSGSGSSQVNGYEPHYEPSKWNNASYVHYNNCYAYAMDNQKSRLSKPQPSDQSSSNYQCPVLKEWIKGDLVEASTGIKYQMFDGTNHDKCPDWHHKIYLVHGDHDYHFYRLDSDGLWSHKPGGSEVTRLDASGQLIVNPETADHNYPNNNYNVKCGFLCVPKIDESF